MAPPSPILRAELARRLRTVTPADWAEFATLWMAFNAIYGGEPDERERSRVMGAIRRYTTDRAARHLLCQVRLSIDRVVAIPPGNMALDAGSLRFREASRRCVTAYQDLEQSSRARLSAIGGVLYQVRCNLVHGDKDPNVPRDRMLVTESVNVLRVLVPALELGAMS